MKLFEGTRKVEFNFYLRYQQMTEEDKLILFQFYKLYPDDDFGLFKRICKFWNTPITDVSAGAAKF